jgi:CheY-like chemotaxis protein
MRLEDMTPALVRRAIAIYLEKAWPNRKAAGPRFDVQKLEDAATLGELFAHFEQPRASEGEVLQRHTLRLGNERYPFMKFVVQEYLVDEEYFFSVDTHDDLDVRSDSPDYFAWLELKKQNLQLKRDIEAAWAKEGLPTNEDLRLIAQGIAQVEREPPGEQGTKPVRVLVVDDESQVAQGLGALLEARGYQVELAYDGREVLERLEHDPLPDLILLDYGMPEVGGEQVLQKVRENPRTTDLPVLLATASSISLDAVPRASGFLRKPYSRGVLFAILKQLLEHRPAKT